MSVLMPIDLERWARRAHWQHFREGVPCSFAVTVELDVTELVRVLRHRGLKVYPSQVWAVATVVNRHEQFRMALTEDGGPGVWDTVHPAFTVFNREQQTFSAVWTPYESDFATFHAAAVELTAAHTYSTEVHPQGPPPPNAFDVSSLPWTAFTAFSLQTRVGTGHLLPIITLGRFQDREGRLVMPVAVQIDHAAADGFHVARWVDDLQQLFDDAESWAS